MHTRSQLLLPLLLLATGCTQWHGVTRVTSSVPTFDPARIEATVHRHQDWDALQSDAWDGESFAWSLQRGDARALLTYETGKLLKLESMWPGRQPSATTLSTSLQLQSDLIRLLRSQCPELAPESAWDTRKIELDAEPDAQSPAESFRKQRLPNDGAR
jgi:hypothetical protein